MRPGAVFKWRVFKMMDKSNKVKMKEADLFFHLV